MHRVLSKDTNTLTISDAIKFWPHNIPAPDVTTEDKIIRALHDINTTISRGPALPSVDQLAAIDTLRAILRSYTTPPPPTEEEHH